MNTVEQYINSFPDEIIAILMEIRRIIINHAPDADEVKKFTQQVS